MILHDITDHTELIEVPASALSPEWLFESYEYSSDVIPVPGWIDYLITKSQCHKILNHFLAKVVVDSVHLLLFK